LSADKSEQFRQMLYWKGKLVDLNENFLDTVYKFSRISSTM
jgi:hypothetical protein